MDFQDYQHCDPQQGSIFVFPEPNSGHYFEPQNLPVDQNNFYSFNQNYPDSPCAMATPGNMAMATPNCTAAQTPSPTQFHQPQYNNYDGLATPPWTPPAYGSYCPRMTSFTPTSPTVPHAMVGYSQPHMSHTYTGQTTPMNMFRAPTPYAGYPRSHLPPYMPNTYPTHPHYPPSVPMPSAYAPNSPFSSHYDFVPMNRRVLAHPLPVNVPTPSINLLPQVTTADGGSQFSPCSAMLHSCPGDTVVNSCPGDAMVNSCPGNRSVSDCKDEVVTSEQNQSMTSVLSLSSATVSIDRSQSSDSSLKKRENVKSKRKSPSRRRQTQVSERPFACEECHQRFIRRHNLEKHISVVHKKLKPHKCPLCERSFAQSPGLHSHIRTVHKRVRKFQCDICSHKFAHKYGLQQHITKHMDVALGRVRDSGYLCSVCQIHFSQPRTLTEHHVDAHNLTCMNPSVCKVYGFDIEHTAIDAKCASNSPKTLVELVDQPQNIDSVHVQSMQSMHATQPFDMDLFGEASAASAMQSPNDFRCRLCGYIFANICERIVHEEDLHDLTSSVYCPLCNVQLKNSTEIKSHLRLQHGVHPSFVCDFAGCANYFNEAPALQKHKMLVHSKSQHSYLHL